MIRSCFEFLQKVFLGLMYPFSCVLWAIFWSFSLLPLLISFSHSVSIVWQLSVCDERIHRLGVIVFYKDSANV